MKYNKVAIESVASFIPEQRLSSEAIEQKLASLYERLKLPHGRLELMTGIKERRFWDKGTLPSDVATQAARQLLANSSIPKDKIQALVHASVCRDQLEPATACRIHHQLKLPNETHIFDLSNACLGVLNGMVNVANMIELGQIQAALVVSGENGGPLLQETIEQLLNNQSITRKEIKKYIANLTIGSAAVAVCLCHTDLAPKAPRLLGGDYMANTSANELCRGDGNVDSLMMHTDSEAMLEHGIRLAKSTWEKTKKQLAWSNADVDHVIGHQVGEAHRRLVLEALELPLEKDFSTFDFLGNTGSAALPITLEYAAKARQFGKGDKVALLGIGSGLNSLMLGVQW